MIHCGRQGYRELLGATVAPVVLLDDEQCSLLGRDTPTCWLLFLTECPAVPEHVGTCVAKPLVLGHRFGTCWHQRREAFTELHLQMTPVVVLLL